MEDFEITSGTIIGREHREIGKNNQDAFSWLCTDHSTVAIVCDGCSEGKHSEVGANIGSRLIAKTLSALINQSADISQTTLWQRLKQDVLAQIRVMALTMGGSFSQTIVDYFLFTTVGVVITPFETIVFSIGDGVYGINEEIKSLGHFDGNQPPYLAYNLVESACDLNLLDFKLESLVNTDEVNSVIIGSDGLEDLIAVEERNIPGQQKLVGSLNQFWLDDSYFKNPDKVRRKLSLVNRNVLKLIDGQLARQHGLLPDDTTLVVVRRK